MAAVYVMVCLPNSAKNKNDPNKNKPSDDKIDNLRLPWQELHLSSSYHGRKRFGIPNNMPLEKILKKTLRDLGINDSAWVLSYDELFHEVTFICDSDDVENIVLSLDQIGIGTVSHTSLSVIPCSVHIKEKVKQFDTYDQYDDDDEYNPEYDYDPDQWQKRSQFMRSIKSRITVAQVLEAVTAMATINFDFVLWLVVACMLSAIGLASANAVLIAASMIVCPLMGPIMSGCFGVLVREKKLSSLALWTEILGFSFCIVYGFIFGLISGYFGEAWGAGPWPTIEMSSRGTIHAFWEGLLVAFLCGAACALATLGANMASWVGTAISASLLPPAVNAGMCWALALILKMRAFIETRSLLLHSNDSSLTNASMPIVVSTALLPSDMYTPQYSTNMSRELAILGIFSLLLTIENVMGIFVIGLLMLKVKEIAPARQMLPSPTFWKEDVKVVREYNVNQDEDSRPFGVRLMEEWAKLHNIDLEKVRAGEEIDEDKIAEIVLSFKDIVETVEKDTNYHRVLSTIPARVLPQPLSKQLPPEVEALDRQFTIENILWDTLEENPHLTPLVVQRALQEDGGLTSINSPIKQMIQSPLITPDDHKYATIGRCKGLLVNRTPSFKQKKRSSSVDGGVVPQIPLTLSATGLRQRRPSNSNFGKNLNNKVSSNINAAIQNARKASVLLTVPPRLSTENKIPDRSARTPVIGHRRRSSAMILDGVNMMGGRRVSVRDLRRESLTGQSVEMGKLQNLHDLRRQSVICQAETDKIRQIAKQGRRPTNAFDKQKLLNMKRKNSNLSGYINPVFGSALELSIPSDRERLSANRPRISSVTISKNELKELNKIKK